MDRRKLFKRLTLLILLIFIANLFANTFYLYSSIWYFDIIMHFSGGFFLGLLALYLFKLEIINSRVILKVLLFVLLIGLIWEIYEVVVDAFFSKNAFDLFDSSSDVFFDLLGGASAIFYFTKRIMLAGENKVK